MSKRKTFVDDDAPAPFVRGKKHLSSVEPAEPKRVDKDILFGRSSSTPKKSSSNKRKATHDGDKKKLKKEKRETDGDNTPSKVRLLTSSKMQVGNVMLGCVQKINEVDLSISLPNGLVGFVSMTHVSDELHALVDAYLSEEDGDDSNLPTLGDLVEVGQFVPVYVHDIPKGKHKISLSMRASLVNKGLSPTAFAKHTTVFGSVKSVEDKGYTLSFGLGDEVQGFLLFGEEPTEGKKLVVGQPVNCVVKSVSGRIAQVSASFKTHTSKSTFLKKHSSLKQEDIRPGLAVTITVEKVLPTGLYVSFLSFFRGTIDLFHLLDPAGSDWEEQYEEGQQYKARIIHFNAKKKTFGLSLKVGVYSLSLSLSLPLFLFSFSPSLPSSLYLLLHLFLSLYSLSLSLSLSPKTTAFLPLRMPFFHGCERLPFIKRILKAQSKSSLIGEDSMTGHLSICVSDRCEGIRHYLTFPPSLSLFLSIYLYIYIYLSIFFPLLFPLSLSRIVHPLTHTPHSLSLSPGWSL